jgi:hypothetical protein
MAGLLTTLRENFAVFLSGDVASGATAYFTDAAKPITVFTEKLKSFEQAITDALASTGLAVVVATATATEAQSQCPDLLAFNNVKLLVRVLENPAANDTGVSASDCAEVIAALARKFKFNGSPLRLIEITLGDNPGALAYDVVFQLAAQATITATRA